MLGVKIVIYSFIFLTSSGIGMLISKKYEERVNELKEFKNALNMFKTKIKFTYEPIPEIFIQISQAVTPTIGGIFKIASYNMNFYPAGEAWSKAIDTDILNINLEDRSILKDLSKLLGATDMDGQLSQIEITYNFLEEQIKKAEKDRAKSEKLYRTMGMIIGLVIVIILMWLKWKGKVKMNIELLFKIAAIGILVAVLHQVLVRAGREDQAMMTTLAGLVIVLTMVIKEISTLFDTVRTLFNL